MTDLNPKARALVQASRRALRPNAGDRARIDAALRDRLGPDACPAQGDAKLSRAVRWKAAAGLALGVCVLGTLALLMLRPAGSPAPATRSAPPPQPPMAASKDSAPTSQLPVSNLQAVTASPPRVATHPKSHARPDDRLARELALLSRATSALHAGDAAGALKTLDEHQRTFPNGLLSEERRAAKAQALCSLGRISEGRAELARLRPHSPSAARVEHSCEQPPSAATAH
jgi:hypothetical protein